MTKSINASLTLWRLRIVPYTLAVNDWRLKLIIDDLTEFLKKKARQTRQGLPVMPETGQTTTTWVS
jgi:hypothetical protein